MLKCAIFKIQDGGSRYIGNKDKSVSLERFEISELHFVARCMIPYYTRHPCAILLFLTFYRKSKYYIEKKLHAVYSKTESSGT